MDRCTPTEGREPSTVVRCHNCTLAYFFLNKAKSRHEAIVNGATVEFADIVMTK